MPVRVEGLSRVVRDLQKTGADVADLKDVFAQIAAEGARLVEGFAPRRSGRLAGSVRGNKAKNKAVVFAGRARIPWAGPVNYGWKARNIKPAHFLARGDAALADKAPGMLEDGLTRLIERNDLG